MTTSRRDFLRLLGGVAAASGLTLAVVDEPAAQSPVEPKSVVAPNSARLVSFELHCDDPSQAGKFTEVELYDERGTLLKFGSITYGSMLRFVPPPDLHISPFRVNAHGLVRWHAIYSDGGSVAENFLVSDGERFELRSGLNAV